ncbi:MAG: hypothetical protein ABW321_14690 [Polyangiales bacterium]
MALCVALCARVGAQPPSAAGEDDLPAGLPDDDLQPSAADYESPDPQPAPDSDYTRPPIRFEGNFLGALALRFAGEGGPASYGFGITYGIGYGALPLMLGIDYMSANANDISSLIALELPAEDASVSATRSAKDRTHYFDAWLRVQPPHWAVRPYIEGFLGTKLLQTQYSLSLSPGSDAAKSDTVTDHAWVGSYGWGAGVDFWGLFKIANTLSVTLGFRQLNSSTASFSRRLLIDGREGIAHYTISTTVFLITAGVMGHFDMSAPRDPYSSHGL